MKVQASRNKPLYGLYGLASAVITAAVVAAILIISPEGRGSETADCNIDSGACETASPETGMTIKLDITPKPVRTMKKLSFSIDLKKHGQPVGEKDLALNLSMPGMYMPQNRVKMKYISEGRYAGEGIMVKCPSGRKIWKAEIVMNDPVYKDEIPVAPVLTFGVDR